MSVRLAFGADDENPSAARLQLVLDFELPHRFEVAFSILFDSGLVVELPWRFFPQLPRKG